ncbi:glycosyltransferase [Winogradskyella sp. 3972H.M.0a.05]|uniref:glycosyltransferase n=1 Tax=Winogradskyella sp. 3972H.M.0a.05 TaxID=2950277 RepID=UPI003394B254
MADRIKILYTIPNFDTAGSGKVVYDLIKGLDRSKFEIEVCCFHDRGAFFKTIESTGVKIHIFRFATSYKPLLSLPFRIFEIRKFFRQNNYDIIHSWHWSSDFTEPLAAKLAGIKFIYTKKAMGWGNKAWTWRSKLSTKIIAINQDMIQQFFKDMNHKTTYLPLGVDTNYFAPQASNEALKTELQIKPDDFVISSIANLVPVKGIEVLLDAIEMLKNEKIKVLIVGNDDNDYGQSLKEKYASKNILFLGKKQDVRPYLSITDTFVIPTKDEGRKEGMPIAPLEAMASETIVLGSRISGIVDILKDFEAYLFEPSNVEMLAEKINKIYNLNADERHEISNSMRDYVVNNLSINQFINNHQTFYQSIN